MEDNVYSNNVYFIELQLVNRECFGTHIENKSQSYASERKTALIHGQ